MGDLSGKVALVTGARAALARRWRRRLCVKAQR